MQVGCGADELIDLLMRCVLDAGDKIIDCPPTFTMYVFDAAVNNASVVTVPRLEGFGIDLEGEWRPQECSIAGASSVVQHLSCFVVSASTCPHLCL